MPQKNKKTGMATPTATTTPTTTDWDGIRRRVRTLGDLNADIRGKVNSAITAKQQAMEQRNAFEAELMSERQKHELLKTNYDVLQREKDELLRQQQSSQSQTLKDLGRTTEALAAKEQELATLAGRLTDSENALQALQANYAAEQAKVKALSLEIDELRAAHAAEVEKKMKDLTLAHDAQVAILRREHDDIQERLDRLELEDSQTRSAIDVEIGQVTTSLEEIQKMFN